MNLLPVVAPINPRSRGTVVVNLQDALLFLYAREALKLLPPELFGLRSERRMQEYGEFTKRACEAALGPLPNEVDERAAKALNGLIDKFGGFGDDDAPKLVITGTLLFPDGRPAARKLLELVQAPFGSDKYVALAATARATDAQGRYSLVYPIASERAEVLAVALRLKDGPLLTKVMPKMGADALVMNLVAPVGPGDASDAESARLEKDIKAAGPAWADLVAAQERGTRRDISRLVDATGWPAGALAFAAHAARLHQPQQGAQKLLSLPTAYALLRAGLPSDPQQLVSVRAEDVRTAIGKAKSAQIVPATTDVEAGVKEFAAFRADQRLAAKLAGTRDTSLGAFVDSLQGAPLPAFKQFLGNYEGDAKDFWKEAEQRLPAADVRRLQGHFALGEVTTFNAMLVARLSPTSPPANPDGMVELGLYDAASLGKQAFTGLSDVELDELVPPVYAANNPKERAALYANDMARKLRRMLPTQVISHQLRTGKIAGVAKGDAVGQALRRAVDLLPSDGGAPFTLGKVPVGRLLRTQADAVLSGVPAGDRPTVVSELHRVQRTYQLSPRNATVPKLLSAGLDSAARIAALPKAVATSLLAAAGLEDEEAQLVMRKAHQVRAATHGVMMMARMATSAPTTTAIRSMAGEPPTQKLAEAIAGSPTLESLFGSLDYCECEHCDSVLSPAAYFVDVLRTLETKTDANVPDTAYDRLVKRRPDLPHIPLTCDNTNTLLPHIDLVNEILEFLVEHDSRFPDDARPDVDNAGVSSDDLIAEPRTVRTGAYALLAGSALRYPPSLPFDLALETARAWCPRLGASLMELLDTTRMADGMDSAGSGAGRRGVDHERLGISPTQVEALTPTSSAEWFRDFGYSTRVESVAGLGSIKALAERINLSYKELFSVIASRFVNPALANEHRFRLAGLDPAQLKFWVDTAHQALLQGRELIAEGPNSSWSTTEYDAWNALSAEQQATLMAMAKVDRHLRRFEPTARQALEDEARAGKWDAALVVAALPAGNAGVQPFVDACDMSAHTLLRADGQALADIDWARLAIFVRWWRKLKWSVSEVDQALHAFIPGIVAQGLTEQHLVDGWLSTFMTHLGAFEEVHARLDGALSREETLCFWTDLPVHGAGSLYARLFLAPSVLQADPVFDSPTGHYLASSALPLAEHAAVVAGALEVSRREVELLAPGGVLDIPTISRLYRFALLARASSFDVAQLLELEDIVFKDGLFASVPTSPRPAPDLVDTPVRAIVRVVDAVRQMRSAGVLLEDVAVWRTDVVGSIDQWRVILLPHVERKAWLAALAGEVKADPGTIDDLWKRLAEQSLGKLERKSLTLRHTLGSGQVVDASTSVAEIPAWSGSEADAKDGFAELTGTFQVVSPGSYKFRVASSVATGSEAVLDIDGQSITLAGSANAAELERNIAVALDISFSVKLVDLDKARPVTVSIELPQPFGWVTLDKLSIKRGENSAILSEAAGVHAAFLRATRMAGQLKLSTQELAYFASASGALDIGAVVHIDRQSPSEPSDSASAWRVFDYLELRSEFPERASTLAQLLDPQSLDDQRDAALAELTERSIDDVIQARTALGHSSAAALSDHSVVRRVWRLLHASNMTGLAPSVLFRLHDLTNLTSTFDERLSMARGLRENVRAQTGKAAWKAVAQPIADQLRRRSRDALVEWLLHVKPTLPRLMPRTLNNLYQWLLIDPGMEPVVQSSRLRLAIGSAQLFVQRVLLGLEDAEPIPIDERTPAAWIDAERWAWMKRYRVWEANRKIFLYPENWLEPEFREDRSHLFRELEGDLLQGEITDDKAEDALLRYLEGLVEIANLDIVSTFLDVSDAPVDDQTLHVLGKTRNDAPKYFYRKREQGLWTPWDPVTVSLTGDHVAPVIWKGRLFLVWISFIEQPAAPDFASNTSTTPAASMKLSDFGVALQSGSAFKTLQLQMNWAERRRDGTWTESRSGDLIHWPRASDSRVSVHVPPLTAGVGTSVKFLARRKDGDEFEPPEKDDGIGDDGADVDTTSTGSTGSSQPTNANGTAGHVVALFPGAFDTRDIAMRCQALASGEMSVSLSFATALVGVATVAYPMHSFSLRLPGRHAKPDVVVPIVSRPPMGNHLYSSHRPSAARHLPVQTGLEVSYTANRSLSAVSVSREVKSYAVINSATMGTMTLPVNRPPLHSITTSTTDSGGVFAELTQARSELYVMSLPFFFQGPSHSVLLMPEGGEVTTKSVPVANPRPWLDDIVLSPMYSETRDATGSIPAISAQAAFQLDEKLDGAFANRQVIRFDELDLPARGIVDTRPATPGAMR